MATDDNSTQPPEFDPVATSATMRTMAETAEHCAKAGTKLEGDFVRQILRDLNAAQTWLDARLADVDVPARRPIVTGDEDAERIGVEALVYTLRYAAIELLQVLKLLELRTFRKKR